jgi:ATP-dependent Lon protease
LAKTEAKNIDLQQSIEIPKKIPLLPIRDIVVFPYMVLPLFVGREMSIKAIDVALEGNRMIFLTSQKDINVENPSPSDLYSVGTVGVIMRMLKLPDGRIKILVQGVARAKTVKFIQKEPFYQVEIKAFPDAPVPVNLETEALMRNVKEQIEKLVSFGKVILPDIMVVIENVDDPGKLADLAVANMGLKVEQAQEILEFWRSPTRSSESNGSMKRWARKSSSCPCSRRYRRTFAERSTKHSVNIFCASS